MQLRRRGNKCRKLTQQSVSGVTRLWSDLTTIMRWTLWNLFFSSKRNEYQKVDAEDNRTIKLPLKIVSHLRTFRYYCFMRAIFFKKTRTWLSTEIESEADLQRPNCIVVNSSWGNFNWRTKGGWMRERERERERVERNKGEEAGNRVQSPYKNAISAGGGRANSFSPLLSNIHAAKLHLFASS